jgi:ABC-type multidrug transport system fused ATPase/permease subunit
MPFIAVASNPKLIETNVYLSNVYRFFHFSQKSSFLIFLGIGFLFFLILTNLSIIVLNYMKIRFTSMREYSLGYQLMEKYLGMDYQYFLKRNSYEFVKNIKSEISKMIKNSLMQFIEFITKLIQALLLTTFLFLVNPISSLIIIIALFIAYGIVYLLIRGKLRKLGEERYLLNRETSRIVNETFWGIKEVKIMGLENSLVSQYKIPSKRTAEVIAESVILGDFPKLVIEFVAFSSIMMFILYSIIQVGNFSEAASSITLYAYAGYRLLPASQGLFKALTLMRYGSATTENIIDEFKQLDSTVELKDCIKKTPMSILSSVEVRNLSFKYPGAERKILNNINFTFKSKDLIGFAGKTGSGKTTLIDVILGLHTPNEGRIIVDDKVINSSNIRSWQRCLGYVPQQIYLTNSSLAENIAFGIPKDKIDYKAVAYAAEMAQLTDFIANELPLGYQTKVGERGVRLSGGQRQRVGIARALYRKPELLIMDEATSALDVHTEEALMSSIEKLMGKVSIVMIAHRLSTLEICNQIYLLEGGIIKDKGTYSELISRNTYFSDLKKNRNI